MLYEINYLVLQSKTSEIEKIREEMKKIIESFDAKVTAEKTYLKRKLSYEITHERYGFFTVLRFEIKDNGQIQELKKNLNINKDVSRYIIVRADELPSLEEHVQKEADIQRKDTLKQDEVEKALAEEAKKTASLEPEVIETAPKKEVEKEIVSEETEKEEAVAEEEKEEETTSKEIEENEKEKKEDRDEKVSLDELDKKLDEILNL